MRTTITTITIGTTTKKSKTNGSSFRGKFYLMRKPWISFPLLEEILSIENACPKQIIYLVEEITLPDILMAEFQEALKISRPSRKRSNGSKGIKIKQI